MAVRMADWMAAYLVERKADMLAAYLVVKMVA